MMLPDDREVTLEHTQRTAPRLARASRRVMNTAAVRSSALGTRIAAVVPPSFSAVPDATSIAPFSDHWNWDQRVGQATITAPAVNTRSRVKSTRPTSAPLRRKTGKAGGGNGAENSTAEGRHELRRRKGTSGRTGRVGGGRDAVSGKPGSVMTARVRVQVGRGAV